MTTVQELRDWLSTQAADACVAIDEGGLMLEIKGEGATEDTASISYFEIGGWPVEGA